MLIRKNWALIPSSFPLLATIYVALSGGRVALSLVIAGICTLAIGLGWAFRGRKQLTVVSRSFLYCSGLFWFMLPGCLFLLLLACSLAGYLPYSDRPGPGWVMPSLPSWEEIRFYAGWELMITPMFAFWGPILFAFAAFLGWLRTPRWLVRIIAGVLCGLTGLILTAAAGWYIALGVFATDAGGIFGLLFGVLVLPKFAAEGGIRLALWLRCVGISAASLALCAAILYPVLR